MEEDVRNAMAQTFLQRGFSFLLRAKVHSVTGWCRIQFCAGCKDGRSLRALLEAQIISSVA